MTRPSAPRSQRPSSEVTKPDTAQVEPLPDQLDSACWACGWQLHASLAGDLYCIHLECPEAYKLVASYTDVGLSWEARARLRAAINRPPRDSGTPQSTLPVTDTAEIPRTPPREPQWKPPTTAAPLTDESGSPTPDPQAAPTGEPPTDVLPHPAPQGSGSQAATPSPPTGRSSAT